MDEVLFKLAPPEFYIWAFLCSQANRQGIERVRIPRDDEEGQPLKVYTRRHLKRILISLQEKKFLVILTSPKNQYGDLVVAIGRRNRLDVNVQAGAQECRGKGFKEANSQPGRTLRAGQEGGERSGVMGLRAEARTWRAGRDPQLSLSSRVKKRLEALAEMDQVRLLRAMHEMHQEELEELESRVMRCAPMARGKKRSKKAKVYAAIRYMQSQEQVKNPKAWVEGVAKRADADMERMRWRDGSSEGDGRLPSRGAYGSG